MERKQTRGHRGDRGRGTFPETLGRFDVGASSELILFVFLMSMMEGIGLIEARRLGVIRRILSTPTPARSILLGRGISRLGISLVQRLVIMLGVGPAVRWRVDDAEMDGILIGGSRYAVERGHGVARDLERCEDAGAVRDADPAQVSQRALQRGFRQVGSLGSGNHFLEVQVIEDVYDHEGRDGVRPPPGSGLRHDPLRLTRPRAPDLY